MKKLLLMAVLCLMTASAVAVPARSGITRTITLSNGTTVKATLVGDEFGHFWLAADGTRYQESNGSYVAVTPEQIEAKASPRRKAAASMQLQRRIKARKSPLKGSYKGLIILVQFADVAFAEGHDQAKYNDIANTPGYTTDEGFRGSVADYFRDQSDGQFNLTFDVVGPVTVANYRSYYGADGTKRGDDKHPGEMVAEACQAIDDEVDFRDYDWDGDGEVDQVFVLYAGQGQADGGSANTIWPHEFNLQSSDYGKYLTLDGVIVNTYACANELATGYDYNYNTYTSITGIGTICHEFSHCLGFPDMYDTTYSGHYGMGRWDLMCSGSYNGDGFSPAGYTAYERMVAGWMEPVELRKDTTITGMKPLSQNGQTYIIYNKGNEDEYYLLENRKQEGWDEPLKGSGLFITHVDYDKYVWAVNNVNSCRTTYYNDNYNSDHQRLTFVPADNEQSSGSEDGDPFPYIGLDSLTNNSEPATTLYNENADGSNYLNVGIYGITVDDEGLVSFNVKPLGSTTVTPPTGGDDDDKGDDDDDKGGDVGNDDYFFYESFDKMNANGGNDGYWYGTKVGNELVDETNEHLFDNKGWNYFRAYLADQCVVVGNSVRNGYVTTPGIKVDGEATLSFKAAAYDDYSYGSTLTVVPLSADGVGLSETMFSLEKGKWTTFTTTLTGSGTVKLNFSGTGIFFLDEVKIPKPGTTGISGIETKAEQKQRIYNLNGQYLGTDLQSLPHGMYIVGGKKVVK